MEKEQIEQYIKDHASSYNSKYKFHSFFKKNEYVYKFHYYLRNRQLEETNLFFEITLTDEIKVIFTEEIHEYEQKALINSGLSYILKYGLASHITVKEIKAGLKAQHFDLLTTPDILMTLFYIEYHQGINQKAIDSFYSFYRDHFNELITKKDFNTIIQEVYAILDLIMYEQIWSGTFNNYLDQQYYYHLYYLRMIFTKCISNMNLSILLYRDNLEKLLLKFFNFPRFTLCMISVLDYTAIHKELKSAALNIVNGILKDKLEMKELLPFRYVQSIYYEENEKSLYYVEEIFKQLIDDIVHLANHDMQIALGNYFLKRYGYSILVNIFTNDYNAFIFRAFPISEIPEEFYPIIKREFVNAIYYYKELMDYPDTRLQALDQIVYINRLILENFKDDMYKQDDGKSPL